MSGRSAIVRQKKGELAQETAKKQHQSFSGETNYSNYGYGGQAMRGEIATNPAYFPHHPQNHSRRPRSISSGHSPYSYLSSGPPPIPRPVIVASAIEKSDFRTHLDGMSTSLRGKLNKIIKVEKPHTAPLLSNHPRIRTASRSSSDGGSTRTGAFTPSLLAVPALSPSTPPPDSLAQYPRLGAASPTEVKRKQQATITQKVRRFEGGGKPPQLEWKSLHNNPELWDENGDTFVYMYMHASRTKPPPSFRIDSKVIEQCGSEAFVHQLHHPQEPEGWPRFYPNDLASPDDTSSPDGTVSSFETPRKTLSGSVTSDFPEIESIRPLDIPSRARPRAPIGIQHELYVAWPGEQACKDSTVWHITTRNFFAVLYDNPALVGVSLYESMLRLFERVNTHPQYLDPNVSRVAWIGDYLTRHRFDDVRNNPSYAASLLGFSEDREVRWREGYIEAFVHCVGMLNCGLRDVMEWRYITPHTKLYLENASLEIEDRVQRAQGWLSSFNFEEMWPTTSAPPSAARGCFDRFRKWLLKYYENAFLHWPPSNDPIWLTRDTVVRLKNDFEGLYDYFVDRDVVFDGTEYRPGQKWVILNKSGQPFKADTSELPLTDILLTFDQRNNFPHIPHPYPLTPASQPSLSKSKSALKLKKPATQAETYAQCRRKSISYAEASNVYTLRDHYMHTDLVANFIRFEQGDMLETIDPFEARRGRWLLIYAILQVLATVSVDSPNLRYKDGVHYHLSAQMKGIVPWADANSAREIQAEHTRSHCWVVPSTWGQAPIKARPGAHRPILWGQYGDGRVRPELLKETLVEEQELGAKKAEEWVASNPGLAQHHAVLEFAAREKLDDMRIDDVSSGNGSPDSAVITARRRRAMIHGFTDFQVPDDW